ncbi:ATP-binding cassette domain-containing protein [Pedobacter sp. Leaf176]|uniref:ATP-binding cassette domain-containing protein n=1 Tax=Pedobacter sp. Leaf176 TaxID=1736286 RepID=UPI0006FF61A6|nr:ATP-binding cassette domain-containing protein [Pedobacter sp. Leaf176]KQR70413.1 molybdenum ABC transporter ATP-binding protein [Pedobacter sp. Leaf176]
MIKIDIIKRIGGRYGNFELKVNTAFHSNSITRIAGPSGIGKTTLLKILAGLILPDAGTITVDDKVWFDKEEKISKEVQERQIGFVFQDYALFPNMTVKAHLKYGTDDLAYINRLLEFGEMAHLENRLPKQLSGGQQQRLAILRALSTKPKLLLLDEPFAALDAELKLRFINKLIPLLAEQKTTVIFASHHDNEFGEHSGYVFNFKSYGN